jgi:3D (Asp-Asp-Asp) domain-containing protein
MSKKYKRLFFISIAICLFLNGISVFGRNKNKGGETFFSLQIPENKLPIVQGNSLLQTSVPFRSIGVVKRIKVIVTGYSSTPFETDEDPYITAAGTQVRDGIVANNLLPLGTKIRIPELYGDKIFVVEDRMHWTKGPYHVDIWFPTFWEAKNFGAKTTLIEILEG